MSLKCDVLVVGAGPAGAVCAAKLAKKKFEVICIDKSSCPGEAHTPKIDIVESKGIEKLVKEFNLDFLSKTNKSVWCSPNNKFTFVSSVKDIFFLRGTSKNSLDNSLFLAMKNNGVDVWFNSKPVDLNLKNGVVSSVVINKKGKKIIVEPKIIVAATGNDSFFSQKLNVTEFNPVSIVGFGSLMKNLSLENNSTYIFFDEFYAPGGYFFVGRVSDKIGIAMVVANKSRLKKPLKDYFYEFIEKNSELYSIFLNAEPINFNSGERTISMISKRVSGNVVFCGDAARTMSPVFAYGVNPAMNSSYFLAQSIIKNGLNLPALTEYNKELKKFLGNEKQRHLFRGIYDKLTNQDFDFLVDSANYLNSKQHLDDLIDFNKYKSRNLVFALLRKPHISITLTLKAAAKIFLPFY
ncbi:MAG: NAD(P)/FAD-dependent oxidoreductase [Candidatus Diapherotrites archaeon]|nr:NAD(P)/FAD-dependent oxidoreductase [Candidatus Diapherotrites archaeon]